MEPLKSIALEEDVYRHILDKLAESGQSASDFLRDKLGVKTAAIINASPAPDDVIGGLLSSNAFRFAKGVVGKFLIVLGWLHSRHRSDFEMVQTIKGRERLYFAR